MQSVDVLCGAERLLGCNGIELSRQRHLDDDPVHRGVAVQMADEIHELILARGCRKPVNERGHSHRVGVFFLARNVGCRRRILPDQHGGKARRDAGVPQAPDASAYFFQDAGRDGFPVNDPSRVPRWHELEFSFDRRWAVGEGARSVPEVADAGEHHRKAMLIGRRDRLGVPGPKGRAWITRRFLRWANSARASEVNEGAMTISVMIWMIRPAVGPSISRLAATMPPNAERGSESRARR